MITTLLPFLPVQNPRHVFHQVVTIVIVLILWIGPAYETVFDVCVVTDEEWEAETRYLNLGDVGGYFGY